MNNDPWTDPDPQAGDFDADLAPLDPRYVAHHEGDRKAKLLITVKAAARRRVRSAIREEVQLLAADESDREPMRVIREQMVELAPPPAD
jgi:hypothetical protein